MHRGYIKLWRRLKDSDIWTKEKFTRGQAWVDLLMLANHKEGFIRKRNIRVDLKRGDIGWSERELADRWKWSRDKVRRFLNELCSENESKLIPQTAPQNKNITSCYHITNYCIYQDVQTTDNTTDDTTNRPQTDRKQDQNKNEKNEKNEKNKRNIYSAEVQTVLKYLNEKKGSSYKDGSNILARLKSGGSVDDCLKIIDNKFKDPYFIENPQHLNPITLFRKSHWDKYLNDNGNRLYGVVSKTTQKNIEILKEWSPKDER